MEKRIESTIEGLLNRVPGYSGYRDKEVRRDDDRRLREAIAASLDNTVTELTRASARLAEQRNLTHISTVERLVGTTRTLADRVRTTSYGYGGIFTDQSVDEFALDQLRQFDARFQQEVESLAAIGSRIANSPEGPLDSDLNAYQDELNRLGLLFDGRRTVVETAKPNRDAAVLSLLETNPTPKQSPLAELNRGDALSLSGSNYLVDATVTFTSPDGVVRLSRIDTDGNGASTWLLGSTVVDIDAARLVEGRSAGEVAGNARPAQMIVDAGGGSGQGVAAQYAYTAGAGGSATFWYAVGDETRFYSGESIRDEDVVVYGQS